MRESEKGEANPSWKGGVSIKSGRALKGAQFTEWRQKVFERDSYTCQDCGAHSSVDNYVALQPHHIKAFAKFPELRFDVSNGVTLCESCHKRHTFWQVLVGRKKNGVKNKAK